MSNVWCYIWGFFTFHENYCWNDLYNVCWINIFDFKRPLEFLWVQYKLQVSICGFFPCVQLISIYGCAMRNEKNEPYFVSHSSICHFRREIIVEMTPLKILFEVCFDPVSWLWAAVKNFGHAWVCVTILTTSIFHLE